MIMAVRVYRRSLLLFHGLLGLLDGGAGSLLGFFVGLPRALLGLFECRPGFLLRGRGRLDELKREIKACDANLVACDDELAPRQERNLEAALGVPVIDRTAVILDIFADHAHSAEGKLQVELAQLEYNMARMRGLWTHLERLGAGRMDGGIGTRGPGESQIETDRRLARDRISALRRRLKIRIVVVERNGQRARVPLP